MSDGNSRLARRCASQPGSALSRCAAYPAAKSIRRPSTAAPMRRNGPAGVDISNVASFMSPTSYFSPRCLLLSRHRGTEAQKDPAPGARTQMRPLWAASEALGNVDFALTAHRGKTQRKSCFVLRQCVYGKHSEAPKSDINRARWGARRRTKRATLAPYSVVNRRPVPRSVIAIVPCSTWTSCTPAKPGGISARKMV